MLTSLSSNARPSDLLRQRLAGLAAGDAYRNYVEVRDRLLAMMDADAGKADTAPSEYWETELQWFDYMFDASPLVVDRLRWHTHHITGIKGYDYRANKDTRALTLKLKALHEEASAAGDPELFVPESPALGGFGFTDEQGRLFHVDTLKYYEVLVALQLAGVLPEFRTQSSERKLAWEIGTGWGGLAYQFMTTCRNTTYVLVDLAPTFIFSATYLKTMFPEARVRFYTEVPDEEFWDDWETLDFVFIPHTRLDLMTPPRCDLVLNTVSFQEMTTEQVRGYVHHAAELEAPFLYSLNRERSLYNPELLGVTRLMEERYWLHEIDVLPVSYVRNLDAMPPPRAQRVKSKVKQLAKQAAAAKPGKPLKEDLDYKHYVGWRRVEGMALTKSGKLKRVGS